MIALAAPAPLPRPAPTPRGEGYAGPVSAEDLGAGDLALLLERGRLGTCSAWRLCRSSAGYWTLYEDEPMVGRPAVALAVPPGLCHVLLDAGRLAPFEVYPSGGVLYELAHAAAARPALAGPRPDAAPLALAA